MAVPRQPDVGYREPEGICAGQLAGRQLFRDHIHRTGRPEPRRRVMRHGKRVGVYKRQHVRGRLYVAGLVKYTVNNIYAIFGRSQ